MTPEEVINNIKKIRKNNPENLMARHFSETYFNSLDKNARSKFIKIITTGLENTDSQMGAYAMNPDDYDVFAPMLEPMIRDFHNIPAGNNIEQKHDWNTKTLPCDLAAIDASLKNVSMRVRVARNVSTFPLPGAMSKKQRVDFESHAVKAFQKLINDPKFGGIYLSITPGSSHEIDRAEYDRRVKAHQMFKDMSTDTYLNSAGISSDWPHGRGMYISRDEDFIIWVGEEDHLRIMSMQEGGNLNALFDRLHEGLESVSDELPSFATSTQYGNVTSCPTNLGTGMRASLHMKLPNATSNGQDLSRLKSEAKALKLAVRGAGGEHSDAGHDGLVDISPSARLGITEVEIMKSLYDGAAALWKMEKDAILKPTTLKPPKHG